MRVWITQCLCPQRHCILATAGEADNEREAEELVAVPLRKHIGGLLKAGTINPWCGLCHAKAETWHYELGRTRFGSLDEAKPALMEEEAKQMLTRSLCGGTCNAAIEEPPMRISVIVPLYNGERFIEAALTSVLAQTVTPAEIIVVDDGSTDAGPAIVAALNGPITITLLRKPNGGQSSARNYGVAHSTSELIALLDQDDIWYPNHLEELAKPYAASGDGRPIGWVYSEVDEIDLDGIMVTQYFIRTHPGMHPKRDVFECLRHNMYVVPSATLISRAAFNAVGGFDERLSGYEDDDLFLRLFRAGYGNVFLDTALMKWRFHAESSSFTNRMRQSRAIYLKKWWDAYPDDVLQNRSVRRDSLLPRFYPELVNDYMQALLDDNTSDINRTREDLLFFVNRMPGLKRKLFGYSLIAMRSPKVTQTLRKRFYLRLYYRLIVRNFGLG